MGRKKIKIQPIKEDRNRSVTYLKRKSGLFKKAHELAVLTDAEVAVIVFGHNGKLAEFCSGDIDQLLLRYTDYNGIAERKGPQHYVGMDKDSGDEDGAEEGGGGGDQVNGKGRSDGSPDGGGPGPGSFSGAASGGQGGSSSGSGEQGDRSGNPTGRGSGSRGSAGSKRKADQPPPTSRAAYSEHQHASGPESYTLDGLKVENIEGSDLGPSASGKQALNAALRQREQLKDFEFRGSTGAHLVPSLPLSAQGHPGQPALNPTDGSILVHSGTATVNGQETGAPERNYDTGALRQQAEGVGMPAMMQNAAPLQSDLGPAAAVPSATQSVTAIHASSGSAGSSGRRSSFSAGVQTAPGGLARLPASGVRPMTANAVLASPYLSNLPQSAVSALPSQQHAVNVQGMYQGFTPSLALQHQGYNEAVQAATVAAAYAAKGAAARGLDVQNAGGGGSDALQQVGGPDIVIRPSSTGNHRSHHSLRSMTYPSMSDAPVLQSASNRSPMPVKMERPYTASGDFASASGHLAPPPNAAAGGAHPGFAAGLSPAHSSMHSYSASPVPSMYDSSGHTPSMGYDNGPRPSRTSGGLVLLDTSVDRPSTSATPDSGAAGVGPRVTVNGQSLFDGRLAASSSASTFSSSSDSDVSLTNMVPSFNFEPAGPHGLAGPTVSLDGTGTAGGEFPLVLSSQMTGPVSKNPSFAAPQLDVATQMPAHLAHHHRHHLAAAIPGARLPYEDQISVNSGLSRR